MCKQNKEQVARDPQYGLDNANEFRWVNDMATRLSNGLASGAVTPAAADGVLTGFLCIAGQEHVHYIRHGVDEIEYTHPVFGYQN